MSAALIVEFAIIAGLAILAPFFILDGSGRWWALVGLVPFGTALTGWCPAYLPFGVSTNAAR